MGELGSVLQQTRGWKKIRRKQESQFLVGRLHLCSQKFHLNYTFLPLPCASQHLWGGEVLILPTFGHGPVTSLGQGNVSGDDVQYIHYTWAEALSGWPHFCPLPEVQQSSERSQSFGPRPGMRTKVEKDQHQTNQHQPIPNLSLNGKWLRKDCSWFKGIEIRG